MDNQVPDFQSDIPEHLLTNASPQDRYIMENISILGQKGNWLTQTQMLQSQKLEALGSQSEEIKIQTTRTNGRVVILEAEVEKGKSVVSTYNLAKTIINNKLFVLGAVFSFIIFFSYVAPWIESHGKGLIPSVVSLFFGS